MTKNDLHNLFTAVGYAHNAANPGPISVTVY